MDSKLKLKNVFFLQKKVSYLGFDISDKRVSPQHNKVEAIIQLAPPTRDKQS